MDKYVIRKRVREEIHADHTTSDSDSVLEAEQPPPQKVPAMRAYKTNLKYDNAWKKTYPWIEYDSSIKSMLCSVVKSMERYLYKPEVLGLLGL